MSYSTLDYKNKFPLVDKLFEKLSNDNRYDFMFEMYCKYSANVKSYNRSYSGSYDYGLPERMERKDLMELKRYFGNVKFEGRYSYEGGFDSDGYLWIVDFDSIKTKAVEKYLNEKIIHSFELGETYKLQEDFIYDDYKGIKAGTIFKVNKIGSGLDNQRELEIISGYYKYNKHQPLTKFIKNKDDGKTIIFKYDPYGRNMRIVKKVKFPISLDSEKKEVNPKNIKKENNR